MMTDLSRKAYELAQKVAQGEGMPVQAASTNPQPLAGQPGMQQQQPGMQQQQPMQQTNNIQQLMAGILKWVSDSFYGGDVPKAWGEMFQATERGVANTWLSNKVTQAQAEGKMVAPAVQGALEMPDDILQLMSEKSTAGAKATQAQQTYQQAVQTQDFEQIQEAHKQMEQAQKTMESHNPRLKKAIGDYQGRNEGLLGPQHMQYYDSLIGEIDAQEEEKELSEAKKRLSEGGLMGGQPTNVDANQYAQLMHQSAQQQKQQAHQLLQHASTLPPDQKAKMEEQAMQLIEQSKQRSQVAEYVTQNADSSQVFEMLEQHNNPQGAADRRLLEGQGERNLTSNLSGLETGLGFDPQSMHDRDTDSLKLQQHQQHLSNNMQQLQQRLQQNPDDTQAKAQLVLLNSKYQDLSQEMEDMGANDWWKGPAYMAGAMAIPGISQVEEAGQTYGIMKGINEGIRGTKAPAHMSLSQRANQAKNALRSAPGSIAQAGRGIRDAKGVMGKGGKALRSLLSGAGKVFAPLAAADSAYAGGKAAFGNTAADEAARAKTRRQVGAGEHLPGMTSMTPGQTVPGYMWQEGLKAVNPVNAARTYGTTVRDIYDTSNEYYDADEQTQQAMMDDIKHLRGNPFHKNLGGGDKGWIQDSADYWMGTEDPIDAGSNEAPEQAKKYLAQRREALKKKQQPAPKFERPQQPHTIASNRYSR
jgi:hypothetical protein